MPNEVLSRTTLIFFVALCAYTGLKTLIWGRPPRDCLIPQSRRAVLADRRVDRDERLHASFSGRRVALSRSGSYIGDNISVISVHTALSQAVSCNSVCALRCDEGGRGLCQDTRFKEEALGR